jgi:hypothetical protein
MLPIGNFGEGQTYLAPFSERQTRSAHVVFGLAKFMPNEEIVRLFTRVGGCKAKQHRHHCLALCVPLK